MKYIHLLEMGEYCIGYLCLYGYGFELNSSVCLHLYIGRKVSVMDVSKKYGLEYRLLHAIMKGHPWYGEWGYNFGSGSYCITQEAYKSSVESLSNLPLSIFVSQEQKPHSRVHDIILYYQSLSEHKLVNMRNLFSFLMGLMHDARKTSSKSDDDTTCKKRRLNASGLSSSWEKSDVQRVEEAMLRVLRAVSGSNWVSGRALRGAVCKLASPELLDYCLSELGGKIVYGGVVNSRCNPQTGVYEFRLDFNVILIVCFLLCPLQFNCLKVGHTCWLRQKPCYKCNVSFFMVLITSYYYIV